MKPKKTALAVQSATLTVDYPLSAASRYVLVCFNGCENVSFVLPPAATAWFLKHFRETGHTCALISPMKNIKGEM